MGVLAELGDKREIELWSLRAKYRVLDRITATKVHEGTVEDILLTARTVSHDLLTVTRHQHDVSYHALMRRLVQLAVEELSKKLK